MSRVLPALGVSLLGDTLALQGSLPPISFSHYPTPAVELLALSLSGRLWRPKRLLLIVDNAQESVADLRDVLAGLHSQVYQQVVFVLFFVERSANTIAYSSWARRIGTTGLDVVGSDFHGPHEHLVGSLAAKHAIYLDSEEIGRITRKSKKDIYRTVELVSHATDDPSPGTMAALQDQLLALLQLARQPLRKSDLEILVGGSALIYYPGLHALESVIARLMIAGMVETARTDDDDLLVFLSATSSPELRRLEKMQVQRLAIASEMYEYFLRARAISSRHSETATARLLYHLARLVDKRSVPAHAQQLVRVALQKGSLSLARQYIEQACDEQARTLEDFYLRLAYFVSAQEYESAALLLGQGDEWSKLRIFRILRAVVNNRLRCHGDSIAEIDQLLAEGVSIEERSVLVSYKVAGLLHEGHFSDAVRLLEEELPTLSPAANFPYFLRNASAAYLWLSEPRYEEAQNALLAAFKTFKRQRDWFGYYTTLSNMGAISAYRGQMDTALTQFRDAHDNLKLFGVHHLEEVGFNYAVTLALTGKRDEAAKRTDNMLNFFESANFPRIQLLSLASVLRLLKGGDQEARALMEQAQKEVISLDLTEPKIYVQLNSAVVARVLGFDDRVEGYLDCARRLAPEGLSARATETATRLRLGIVERSEALDLFNFDFHQYWSQNPFELLPVDSLAA